MKINPEEVEMFKVLNKSETGKLLSKYCTRLMDYICDIRNLNLTNDERKTIASLIEDNLIKRIQLQNNLSEVNPNEYI